VIGSGGLSLGALSMSAKYFGHRTLNLGGNRHGHFRGCHGINSVSIALNGNRTFSVNKGAQPVDLNISA